ncbi:DUF2207 domain-containing protein [Nocardioides agariphilus]|jgi:hypothetical protein|uniref:DUF2207 domain-containing protein n=1 Tax=Nocardioides agariphilus TaxID=433664 RepID=A0A930VQ15_9ACTN|nr:DUF2207 domain-containing protein [Nocardioides agariphilus]MBF4769711.1 DUF2207 domain-containing protein [Nocardioides agariphilus]
MRRVVGVVVWLAVVVGTMLWPAVSYNWTFAPTTYEETTIRNYDADFTVDADGDLHAVETLTVDFPGYGKHGIFRFFDEADQSQTNARRVPHDFSVTLDGSPEPYEVLDDNNGRITNLKIGSADVLIDAGLHTYVITYSIDGVLEKGTTGQRTQFYWNLIPGGWLQAIDNAHLTVHLPTEASGVQCARGSGQTGGCTAEGDGTDTLTVDATDLLANTPVTVKVGLDMATPERGTTVPWAARFDPVLGRSPTNALIVLLLAAAAGMFGLWQARKVKEKTPPFPLQYAPPDGVGPAQAAYLLTERTGKKAFVASVMQAAAKGAVTLERPSDKSWTVTDTQGPQGWAGLDSVTQRVARLTGGPGLAFTASSSSVSAGEKLKTELAGFEAATRSWAKESGNMQSAGLGCLGGLFVIGGGILALAIAGGNLFDMGLIALIPAALAAGAGPVLATGANTKRTAQGRELWSKVGGFKRVLSTPSSQSRFDFSGRRELYTAYIPWAVAFDCADEWAAKYRAETGQEPPVPTYFPGYTGDHTGNYTDQMVNSFSNTVDGAISSYQATQSSSSSGGGGGGGFSGGGGGGGGGGGSW